MRAFTLHLGFEFRIGIRNKTLLLMNYLFPLGCYLMFGALFGDLNPGFRIAMVPAMAVFAIMTAALLGMPDTLVGARNAGILRSYKVNGVPALSLLAIPVLTSMMHALVVALLIAATAPALFGGSAPRSWAGFLLVFGAAAFAFAGAGALIGVVSANTRMTVLLSQLIFVPSMILGGLILPVSVLPDALVPIARILPTSYAMDAFAGLAMGQDAPLALLSLAILLAGGTIAFGLAVLLFGWDPKNSTRRGHPAWAVVALLPYAAGAALY